MSRLHHWFGLAAIGVLLTGCVAQDKYSALQLDRDRLAEQLGIAQQAANSERAKSDAYQRQLEMLGNTGNSKDALLANQAQQVGELQKQLEELNSKYRDALNRPVMVGGPLPAPLANELSEFARQNPDLVDFDAARGAVKFKSDVSFSTGSADLTDKAKNAIARFAAILNSAAAAGYELNVVGHTDNMKVVNPQTIAKGHLDNWYLSSHRAISVGKELQAHQVGSQRIAVVGYADQRPVSSNASESGRAQNRRVEVVILPNTIRSAAVTSERAPSRASAPRRAPALPFNKDTSVGVDRGGALNK